MKPSKTGVRGEVSIYEKMRFSTLNHFLQKSKKFIFKKVSYREGIFCVS